MLSPLEWIRAALWAPGGDALSGEGGTRLHSIPQQIPLHIRYKQIDRQDSWPVEIRQACILVVVPKKNFLCHFNGTCVRFGVSKRLRVFFFFCRTVMDCYSMVTPLSSNVVSWKKPYAIYDRAGLKKKKKKRGTSLYEGALCVSLSSSCHEPWP